MSAVDLADLAADARPFRLPDGAPVRVRPIRPQDGDMLQAYLRRLSPASRRNRFLGALNELSPRELERLVRMDCGGACARRGRAGQQPLRDRNLGAGRMAGPRRRRAALAGHRVPRPAPRRALSVRRRPAYQHGDEASRPQAWLLGAQPVHRCAADRDREGPVARAAERAMQRSICIRAPSRRISFGDPYFSLASASLSSSGHLA